MKLVLAPMATLTHQALRYLIHQFGGCDEYFTEMIQAGTLITGGPFERYYLLTNPEPEKIVWQLTGTKTAALVQATETVCKLGGIGVDINMGCCAPDIVRSGAGIAWMIKPIQETKEMLRKVGNTIENFRQHEYNPRFSVKIRLGDENFTEEGFFTFVDMVINEGVQQITLHPRTRKEKYKLPPKYQYVEKLCNHVKKNGYPVDIIVNGGISDSASLNKAMSFGHGTAAAMIGRAAIQKPWIFSQLKGIVPAKIDLLQTGLDFISYLEKFQPKEFYKTRLQRFFAYYSDNVKFSHHLRTQLLNNPTPEGCQQELEKYFAQCPHERFIETSQENQT